MTPNDAKAILITGAAGGLGSALSMLAAVNGWQVIMMDKNQRALEKLYDAIVVAGGVEPILQPLDLSAIGPEDCQQLATALRQQFAGLDALVHCAVSFSGLQPLDLIKPDTWLEQMQVNVNAPWLLSVNLLPLLRARAKSSLIFVLDEQAKSRALWGAYGVSKAAVQALADHFRAELKSTTICVHAVEPGPMRTALRSSVYHSENPVDVEMADPKARQLLSILEAADKKRELIMHLDNREGEDAAALPQIRSSSSLT